MTCTRPLQVSWEFGPGVGARLNTRTCPQGAYSLPRAATHTHIHSTWSTVYAHAPLTPGAPRSSETSLLSIVSSSRRPLTCRKKPKGDKADGGPPPPRGRHAVRYSCIPHGAIIKRSSPLFTSEGEWGDGEQPGVSAISQARVPSGWSDLQPLQGFGDLVGGVGTNVTGGGARYDGSRETRMEVTSGRFSGCTSDAREENDLHSQTSRPTVSRNSVPCCGAPSTFMFKGVIHRYRLARRTQRSMSCDENDPG